jgi:hypothetical protein
MKDRMDFTRLLYLLNETAAYRTPGFIVGGKFGHIEKEMTLWNVNGLVPCAVCVHWWCCVTKKMWWCTWRAFCALWDEGTKVIKRIKEQGRRNCAGTGMGCSLYRPTWIYCKLSIWRQGISTYLHRIDSISRQDNNETTPKQVKSNIENKSTVWDFIVTFLHILIHYSRIVLNCKPYDEVWEKL